MGHGSDIALCKITRRIHCRNQNWAISYRSQVIRPNVCNLMKKCVLRWFWPLFLPDSWIWPADDTGKVGAYVRTSDPKVTAIISQWLPSYCIFRDAKIGHFRRVAGPKTRVLLHLGVVWPYKSRKQMRLPCEKTVLGVL